MRWYERFVLKEDGEVGGGGGGEGGGEGGKEGKEFVDMGFEWSSRAEQSRGEAVRSQERRYVFGGGGFRVFSRLWSYGLMLMALMGDSVSRKGNEKYWNRVTLISS